MPLPSWETLIAGVRNWTQGTDGAVHKPLLVLMILARAQHGGSNVFKFAEVDEPLRDALRAFGPPRKHYRSEYPFWYLKHDGFWTVRDEARLESLKKGREPSRGLLREEDAAAEVPAALWNELEQPHGRAAALASKVLAAHWAAERHAAIVAQLGLVLPTA